MKAGDLVCWESQAGGHRKVKCGWIIKEIPDEGFPEAVDWPEYKCKWEDGGILPRKGKSYLVMVKNGGGKPYLYWPLVSKLKEV